MKRASHVVAILTAVSLASGLRAFAQPRFEIPLIVTDGEVKWQMHLGILPEGHFCIDIGDSLNGHYEFERGAWPPGGLEAWFVRPGNGVSTGCFGVGSENDYRPFRSYAQRDTFRVNVSPWGNPTLIISWPPGLSTYFGELILKDVATEGARYTINMLTTTSVDFSDLPIPHFRIYSSAPRIPNDTLAVSVQLQPGWNMVSNPVIAANDSVPLLFPVCLGCGVGPPPTWIDSCLLHPGMGRWLKCPTGGTTNIMGLPITNDSIRVVAGWNMIGSISYPVAVSTIVSIPPGIRASDFFAYTSRYAKADTIQPGHAYWVKMNQAGRIVLSSGF